MTATNGTLKRSWFLATLLLSTTAIAATDSSSSTPVTFPESGVALGGGAGYGRMIAPESARPGTLRLGLRGSFFRGSTFPVTGTDTDLYGELSVGYGIWRDLELYLDYSNSSNANTAADPQLVQAEGDGLVGLKWARGFGDFRAGGDLRFDLKNGVGNDVWSLADSTVSVRALGGWVRRVGGHPLEVDANAGVALGRAQDAFNEQMTPALLFGTELSGYNRFLAAVGARYDLGIVSPFLTLDLDLPLGVAEGAFAQGKTSAFGAAAKRLSIGARIRASHFGAFDVFAEVAGGTGVTGWAATEPWSLGAAYSFVFDGGLYRLPPPPPPPATTGRVTGTVVDAKTGKPLANAVVTVAGATVPPVATGPDGQFLSHVLAAGSVTFHVERQGYRPASGSAVVKAGALSTTRLAMSAIPPPPPLPPPPPPLPPRAPTGFVAGKVGAHQGSVSGFVRLIGPTTVDAPLSPDGSFSERVPTGHYVVAVLPDHQLARDFAVDVTANQVAVVTAQLEPRPEKDLFRVAHGRLVPLRAPTLSEWKPRVARTDLPLMVEIADYLARHPKTRLTVQVDSGPARRRGDDRVRWTQQRADAFLKALIADGADPQRVAAKGMGLTDPLYPMLSRDRMKNQRVEFVLSKFAPQVVPPATPSMKPRQPPGSPDSLSLPALPLD